jgi:hypothetical protein
VQDELLRRDLHGQDQKTGTGTDWYSASAPNRESQRMLSPVPGKDTTTVRVVLKAPQEARDQYAQAFHFVAFEAHGSTGLG